MKKTQQQKQKKITEKSQEPEIFCRYSEIRDIGELKENPKNPNKHPKFQLERLAEVIKGNGWRAPVTVSDRSGYIVKGHGRLQAAKLAGLTKIPVEIQHYETAADEMADLLADNKIAELAEMDGLMVKQALEEMQADGADIALAGYSLEDFESMTEDTDEAISESIYEQKHEPIIYEPHGECPPVKELVEREKAEELIDDIKRVAEAGEITEEERDFLLDAATRHLRFSFEKCAEYYAHATPAMQDLMEKSALVIIDFDKAIEYGYVKLRSDLLSLREQDGVKTAED